MTPSRRDFLIGCGAGAAAWLLPGGLFTARSYAAEITPEKRRELADLALDAARKAGASYADIRINRYRSQIVTMRSQTDRATGKLNQVPTVADGETFGFGVRALAGGAWGFAASNVVTREEVLRAAKEAVGIAKANASLRREPVRLAPVPKYEDVYRTPIAKDPFDVPIGEKLDLLRRAGEEAKKVPGVFTANGFIAQRVEHRWFASTEGSRIEQHVYQIAPEMTTTAVEQGRKQKSRTYRPHSVTAGYEAVERADLLGNARRIGEEAVNHLKAPSVTAGKKDLVLLPTHLGLTIHESIGHATELDRALGYEANYAGTSFLAPPEKMLGTFRYGPETMNIKADRSQAGALSTIGYDDDGVKPEDFMLVKNGVLVDYQTTREQAGMLKWWYDKQGLPTTSRGCCYAQGWNNVQFQRMPNVSLMPGERDLSWDDLIAATDRG